MKSAADLQQEGEQLFGQEKYAEAKAVFNDALKLGGDETALNRWIRKCDAEIGRFVKIV